MIELTSLLMLIFCGVFVGLNIGANDTGNCVGTTVGAELLSFRRAVLLVAIFALLGAVLQGEEVMDTIGQGIVKQTLSWPSVIIVLLCSGILVSIATFLCIPVSTTQSIIGAIIGSGLAVDVHTIYYSECLIILLSWIICPFFVLVLANLLFHGLQILLRKTGSQILAIQNALGWLAVLASCYVAFSMGANNVGDAIGPISNLSIMDKFWLLWIGGVSIALGAIVFGKRVAYTVGKGITKLDIPSAFVAQIASAIGIHFFSIMGMPIATSSATVGAIAGVGLVKGSKSLSKSTIKTIVIGWIVTPCLAGGLSFLFCRLLKQ